MNHHVTLEPVKLRRFKDIHLSDTSEVVAYRWRCSCGLKGRTRGTWRAARTDSQAHLEAMLTGASPVGT